MAKKWLTNKKIVVVGSTTGLGLSAAQAFVEHGAKVIVVGRNPDSCLLAAIHLGQSAKALAADAAPRASNNDLIMDFAKPKQPSSSLGYQPTQRARWATTLKLKALCDGAKLVRATL